MCSTAEVTRLTFLSMQVCVPEDWTDEQVSDFANTEKACPSSNGWHIRKEGDPSLCGDPERSPCEDRCGHVHVMLDC